MTYKDLLGKYDGEDIKASRDKMTKIDRATWGNMPGGKMPKRVYLRYKKRRKRKFPHIYFID